MQILLLQQQFHRVESLLDGCFFFERQHHPLAQQPRPHGRHGVVQNLNQRYAAFLLRKNEFEVAYRETVEPDVLVLFQPRDAAHVANFLMFGFEQVMDDDARRHHTQRQQFHTVAFQGSRSEVRREFLEGKIIAKAPVFQREGVEFVAEEIDKFFLAFFTK